MKTLTLTALSLTFFFSTLALAEGPPQQQWVSRYAGTGNFDDIARAVTTDSSGNVYVTGRSKGIIGYDFVTVKYDSAGNQLWASRFDSSTHGNEYPNAIAVDTSGNVYVTGQGVTSLGQYITVKYDPNGNQLWVSYYVDSTSGAHSAKAIAVDNSGNVYVTGASSGGLTKDDYATIKYDPNGVQLWVARYTGPSLSIGIDSAEAIALDSSDNVYVTGYSNSSTGTDYATVKYNSNGNQLWVTRYNGTGNVADSASTIAVDSAQNVYVGGASTGSGTNYDCTIVKYNSSGTQQWVARYDAANSIDRLYKLVLDSSANVYVTGDSNSPSSGYDYVTIKYSSAGSQLWVARYNGPGNGKDIARDIAIDSSGNTYVTGYSSGTDTNDYATIKYSPDGNQLWVSRYNGPANGQDMASAITLRGANLYVTGESKGIGTFQDYATIKYDLNGNQIWAKQYNGQAYLHDAAYSVVIDERGNVYTTGLAAGNTNSYDCTTIKYDSNGGQIWAAQYDAAGYEDIGQKVVVDCDGNVYVTALSYASPTPSYPDYATIKYDPNGNQIWAARYNGPGNRTDDPEALVVDNLGNVYVTGYSLGSGTGYDYATIKYGPDGNQLWVARYSSTGNQSDQAKALAVDNGGNVYVTGSGYGSNVDDYVTIKYDPNGSQLWLACYNGSGATYTDEATAIAVDVSGNVYVTGESYNSSSNSDYATIKYDPNGNQLWVARYNGTGNSYDSSSKLVIDDSCNVYVTGNSTGSTTYSDYATVKYRPDGNQAWVARYSSPGALNEQANGLAVDHFGNVYVTGVSDENYVTIKYDPNGSECWLISYNGPGNGHDLALDLAIDDFGSVYVTGESASILGDYDYATIKYTQHDYCFETLAGDYNGDCKVEFTDFAILAETWLAGYGLPDLKKLADDWLICNLAIEGECW